MRFLAVGVSLGVLAGSASAQYMISAHAGVVQYVEGRAYLNDQVVEPKFGQFPDIKENQEFRTEEGRAEILLTPGVFLRLGENSSIRMLSTRLTDAKVEVLSGSAMIECSEVPKESSIQAVYRGNAIRFEKQGLYRIDTEPARLRLYEGEAVVTDGTGQLALKGGKQTNLSGVLLAESFDRKDQDSLYSWSDRRAAYVAQANIASASTVSTGGYNGYGGYGLSGGNNALGYNPFGYNSAFLGGWMLNPMFGMYTYMPYGGFGYSPFGYTYYSPYTVGYAPVYSSAYTSTAAGRLSGITGASRMANVAASARGGSALASAARHSGGGAAHFGSGGGHAGGGGHR
ncbi:MAG: hypothetical protein ABSH31_19680 [Bryobacteraceae bacterium]|jgi:hypothetical protein